MRTSPTAFLFMVLACGASAADWLTDGGDIRRTNHQTDETVLTKANVNGLQLLWKTKLDNTPRQMHSLLEPLVIGRLNTKKRPSRGGHRGRFVRQRLRPRCEDRRTSMEASFRQHVPRGAGGTSERSLSRRHDGERDYRSREELPASTLSTRRVGTDVCT